VTAPKPVKTESTPREVIQRIYDDPAQDQLADRIEEMLLILEADPGDKRVRRHEIRDPNLWLVRIYGSKREFAFTWEERADAIWITWAGDL
jgi:hypothetical protein